jgi:hypothetical protein
MGKIAFWQTSLAGLNEDFFTKRDLPERHQCKSFFAPVDKFQLPVKAQSEKVKTECRPRAVLEAASLTSVASTASIEFGPQSFCRRQNNSACVWIFSKALAFSKLLFKNLNDSFFTCCAKTVNTMLLPAKILH